MTLIELLKIERDGMDAASLSGLRFAERIWAEMGRPIEREILVRFLESFLARCVAVQIRYPKILLRRKKEIERGDFQLKSALLPASVPLEPGACPRCGGRGFTCGPGADTGSLCMACLGTGRRKVSA